MTAAVAEPEIVVLAQRARDDRARVSEIVEAWGRTFVYAQSPAEAPRLYVADLGSQGRWASVFSTTERLAAAVGECDALGMTGMDFVEFTPPGVGLVLDPYEEHALPLPPKLIERAAQTLGVRRAA